MKTAHIFIRSALIIVFLFSLFYDVSGQITYYGGSGKIIIFALESPSGARQAGMGETGIALADNVNALSWNPAGLGIKNSDLFGSVSYFGTAEVDGYTQRSTSFCFQFNKESIGGFGFSINGVDYPDTKERVYTLGWGFNFSEIGIKNHYFGVAAKIISSGNPRSNLSPNLTCAFDLGYLWRILNRYFLGISMQNKGPSMYRIDESSSVPLPVMMNAGLGYKDNFSLNSLYSVDIAVELTLRRYFKRNNVGVGVEAIFLNSFALRGGYFHCNSDEEQSFRYGLGIKLWNHLDIDFYQAPIPRGENIYYTAFKNKWGLEISLTKLLKWERNDLKWWKGAR